MSELTDKQKKFCQEYLLDLNATRAAIRAGYSEDSAKHIGYENLTKPYLVDYLQCLMEERSKRLQVDGDDVLKELMRLGYSDMRVIYNENGTVKHPTEWPEELARAVASIEVEETFERDGKEMIWTGYTKKVKFWNKPQALDLLGKHKKLFTEKIEHSGNVTLEQIVAAPKRSEDSKS